MTATFATAFMNIEISQQFSQVVIAVMVGNWLTVLLALLLRKGIAHWEKRHAAPEASR